MISISLCMIVKNEEENLARCLDSARGVADEIVIVDTGSVDGTKAIARRYTEAVYDFEWIDDFAAARNFAFSKARMDYWMWLDADDVIEDGDRETLIVFKASSEGDFDVAMMPYHTAFDESGNPTFSYRRERIIRRVDAALWQGAVHEVIAPFGRVVQLAAAISHKKSRPSDSDRNLRIYERQRARGHRFSARELYYYARELYYHARYEDAVLAMEEFLSREDAWIENKIEACQIMAYCRYQLGDEERALAALFRAFAYDRPRAEICCDVGKHFFDRARYGIARYWYGQALLAVPAADAPGFRQPDSWGYIPYIQLSLCSFREGDVHRAREFNELAGQKKPNDAAYLANKRYFETLS